NPQVTVHQRLSYEELFALYRECAVVVVPLKPGITYPSGIRALFEAMVLNRPRVATRNEVLLEYMAEGVHGDLVPARDAAALRAAILASLERGDDNAARVEAAAELIRTKYDASVFVSEFEAVLERLTAGGQRSQ